MIAISVETKGVKAIYNYDTDANGIAIMPKEGYMITPSQIGYIINTVFSFAERFQEQAKRIEGGYDDNPVQSE